MDKPTMEEALPTQHEIAQAALGDAEWRLRHRIIANDDNEAILAAAYRAMKGERDEFKRQSEHFHARLQDVVASCDKAETRAEMLEICESAGAMPAWAIALFEREGFVFDGSGGRWEKLAFTLYSHIVELSTQSREVQAKAEGKL